MATMEGTHVECSSTLLGDAEPQEDHDGVSGGESEDGGGSDDEGGEEGGSEEGGSEDGGSEDGASDDGEEDNDDGDQAEDGDGGGEVEKDEDNKEDEEGNPNAGWAEAMAKILKKKTPESKPSILLKNKQLDKIKEKEKEQQLERKKLTDKRRAWESMCREKPDVVKDRENERNLQRIATRGVVQLFNAVRKHQQTVDERVKEAGGSERKKAKLLSSVSKRDFINVLRGEDGGSEIKTEKQTASGAAEQTPAWSVLRDDFMMGASMKDWDKESDGEEEEGAAQDAPGGAEDYDSESD